MIGKGLKTSSGCGNLLLVLIYLMNVYSFLQSVTERQTITHIDLQGEHAKLHSRKESETVSFSQRSVTANRSSSLSTLRSASVLCHSCVLQPSRLLCSFEELCSASCCFVVLQSRGPHFCCPSCGFVSSLLRPLLPPCGDSWNCTQRIAPPIPPFYFLCFFPQKRHKWCAARPVQVWLSAVSLWLVHIIHIAAGLAKLGSKQQKVGGKLLVLLPVPLLISSGGSGWRVPAFLTVFASVQSSLSSFFSSSPLLSAPGQQNKSGCREKGKAKRTIRRKTVTL